MSGISARSCNWRLFELNTAATPGMVTKMKIPNWGGVFYYLSSLLFLLYYFCSSIFYSSSSSFCYSILLFSSSSCFSFSSFSYLTYLAPLLDYSTSLLLLLHFLLHLRLSVLSPLLLLFNNSNSSSFFLS